MQSMDRNLARGAQAYFTADGKPVECLLHTKQGDLECFLVAVSFNRVSVEREGQTRTVAPESVLVEDETAETFRAYFERVMDGLKARRGYGQGAASRTGTYSQGRMWR